jgi:O-acetyl-ADP-ribose deacetylase (regulator of RNase III)
MAEGAIDEFARVFAGIPNVTFSRAPVTQLVADCLATTANSYGRMDGGVDGAVNSMMTHYEPNQTYFHERVQALLRAEYCGEQPVGTCMLVPTFHPRIRWVAHMPTMKVPGDVSGTINAYLAFRALLVSINKHSDRIQSVICPPCCTSSGQMSLARSAEQMLEAYKSVYVDPPVLEDWPSLHQAHRRLLAL